MPENPIEKLSLYVMVCLWVCPSAFSYVLWYPHFRLPWGLSWGLSWGISEGMFGVCSWVSPLCLAMSKRFQDIHGLVRRVAG